MGSFKVAAAIAFVLATTGSWVWAGEPATEATPFDYRIHFRFASMWANQNTQLRLDGDSGLGVSVDLEDFFDLEEELAGVFQFTVGGHFAKRHGIALQYYELNRSAESVLNQDWSGDGIEASAGARADTTLDVTIVDISYGYHFIKNHRHSLSGTAGLFWISLDVSVQLQGDLTVDGGALTTQSAEASGRIGVPLPVFGLNYDFAIMPKWLLGVDFQYFALRTNDISGALIKVAVDTRYYFWNRFEVGGGLTTFDLNVELDTDSLSGRLDWSFWGPQLFLGARF